MMITGIVLAGGKSSRMGVDKCLLKMNDFTFIEKAANVLSNICDNILLSSNRDEFQKFGFDLVKDIYSDIGPLGGIHASLQKSKTETNIIIACDLPFLTADLLTFLLAKSDSFDAVVPVFEGKVETLAGVYKKVLLPEIEEQINQKQYKILSLLESVNTLFLPISKSLYFYSDNLFRNINTMEDYESLI